MSAVRKRNKQSRDEKSEIFNKLVSSNASTVKSLNHDAKHTVTSWNHDMQGRAHKCVERYCKLANKTADKLHKVSTAAWMTTNSKTKNWNEFLRWMHSTGRTDE